VGLSRRSALQYSLACCCPPTPLSVPVTISCAVTPSPNTVAAYRHRPGAARAHHRTRGCPACGASQRYGISCSLHRSAPRCDACNAPDNYCSAGWRVARPADLDDNPACCGGDMVLSEKAGEYCFFRKIPSSSE